MGKIRNNKFYILLCVIFLGKHTNRFKFHITCKVCNKKSLHVVEEKTFNTGAILTTRQCKSCGCVYIYR